MFLSEREHWKISKSKLRFVRIACVLHLVICCIPIHVLKRFPLILGNIDFRVSLNCSSVNILGSTIICHLVSPCLFDVDAESLLNFPC